MARTTSSFDGGIRGSGKVAVKLRRLVGHTVGGLGDSWGIWRGNVASVSLGVGHRDTANDVDTDGGLKVSIANFEGTILSIVGHVVCATYPVVNVLAVRRLVSSGGRRVTDGEAEGVAPDEAVKNWTTKPGSHIRGAIDPPVPVVHLLVGAIVATAESIRIDKATKGVATLTRVVKSVSELAKGKVYSPNQHHGGLARLHSHPQPR